MSRDRKAIVLFASGAFFASLALLLVYRAPYGATQWIGMPLMSSLVAGALTWRSIATNGRLGGWRGATIAIVTLVLGCVLLALLSTVTRYPHLQGIAMVVVNALVRCGWFAALCGAMLGRYCDRHVLDPSDPRRARKEADRHSDLDRTARYCRRVFRLAGGYLIACAVAAVLLLVSITDANAGLPALFFGGILAATAAPVFVVVAILAGVSLAKRERFRDAMLGILFVSCLIVWLGYGVTARLASGLMSMRPWSQAERASQGSRGIAFEVRPRGNEYRVRRDAAGGSIYPTVVLDVSIRNGSGKPWKCAADRMVIDATTTGSNFHHRAAFVPLSIRDARVLPGERFQSAVEVGELLSQTAGASMKGDVLSVEAILDCGSAVELKAAVGLIRVFVPQG